MPPAMDIWTALTLDSEREANRIVRFVRRQLARTGRERVVLGLPAESTQP